MVEVVNDQSQLEQELLRLRAENRALKRSRHGSILQGLEFTEKSLHGAKSVVFVKDLEGRYLQINKRFEEVTRKSRKEIIGKTDREIFGENHYQTFESTDQAVKMLGQEIEFEELIPVDGDLHTFITQKLPLKDDKGELCAVCGISTDVSEREMILEDLVRSRQQHEEAQRLAQLGH